MEKNTSPGQPKGLSKLVPHLQHTQQEMLRVKAQRINSPLHTPPATHRLGAFWAKDFAINGSKEIHLVWTVFWNQLPVWPYITTPGSKFGNLTVCCVKTYFPLFKTAGYFHLIFPLPIQWEITLPNSAPPCLCLSWPSKANFYDFHRSLQWAQLLAVAAMANSSPHFLIPSLSIPPYFPGSCFPSSTNLQSHSLE